MESTMNCTTLTNHSAAIESVTHPTDTTDLQRIFDSIYMEIKQVISQIQKHTKKTRRAPSLAPNTEKTVILQDISSLLESKTSIINEITKHIKNSDYTDFPHHYTDAVLGIPTKLHEETESCRRALDSLNTQNTYDAHYLERLRTSRQCLEEMCGVLEQTIGTSDDHLAQMRKVASHEAKQCQKDLERILESLFPEDDEDEEVGVREMLAKLLDKSKSGDDEWYELTDPAEFRPLAFLWNYGVVIQNTRNPRLYKLILN